METGSLSNVQGNFQTLRNMWSSKVNTEEKPARPISIVSHPPSEQKKPLKHSIPTLKITNETITIPTIKRESSASPTTERSTIFEFVEKMPSIEEHISLPIPPPAPSIIFQHQAQSIATLKQTVTKISANQKKNSPSKVPKSSGIHRWHITRHVFRSGLIFNRTRRASDSILPLLMKTHQADHHHHPRSNSMDSTLSQSQFESLINYVTHNKENDKDSLNVSTKTQRSTSDTSDCTRRNKLDDSIFQYEMILRHLKNYEQFMSTYPVPSSTPVRNFSKQREQSVDSEPNNPLNDTEAKFLARTSIPNRQTQSLSRNVGRTFSEFIMNDLFLSSPSKEQRQLSISHASSQTDLSKSLHEAKDETNDTTELTPPVGLEKTNSVTTEEAKVVLNELDTMLDNSNQEIPMTPNTEINVIVVNPPITLTQEEEEEEETLPREKPLMQRLFEGKKTAYTPADLQMESIRIPEEMVLTYETAKKKCFFDSEQLVYTSRMVKIRRRGYTQHVRMLCITTQRVYNLTKRDPYPKEGLLFKDILGITCTPYRDGFVCIHTKETYEDRGDWLILLEHPCEFITQLFMIMGRNNNDDHFLKFETKFTHCRRCYGEASSNDCSIEARLSDTFRIKKADFDAVIIFTP